MPQCDFNKVALQITLHTSEWLRVKILLVFIASMEQYNLYRRICSKFSPHIFLTEIHRRQNLFTYASYQ